MMPQRCLISTSHCAIHLSVLRINVIRGKGIAPLDRTSSSTSACSLSTAVLTSGLWLGIVAVYVLNKVGCCHRPACRCSPESSQSKPRRTRLVAQVLIACPTTWTTWWQRGLVRAHEPKAPEFILGHRVAAVTSQPCSILRNQWNNAIKPLQFSQRATLAPQNPESRGPRLKVGVVTRLTQRPTSALFATIYDGLRWLGSLQNLPPRP